MPNFITENPAMKRFAEASSQADATRLRDVQLNRANIEAADADAASINAATLDRSLRAAASAPSAPAAPAATPAMPPTVPQGPSVMPAGGGPASPAAQGVSAAKANPAGMQQPQTAPQGVRGLNRGNVAQAYLNTPGYAEQGIKLQMQQEEQSLKTVLELAKTDPQSAIAWADANQVPVPEGMKAALTDRAFAIKMADTWAMYESMYPGGQNIQRRFKAFMQHMAGYMTAKTQQGQALPASAGMLPVQQGGQVDPSALPDNEAPRASTKLVPIQDENGNVIYVAQEDAVGQTPAPKTTSRKLVPVQKEDGSTVWMYEDEAAGHQVGSKTPQGQKDPAVIRTLKYFVESGIAANEMEAWKLYNTSKENPIARARLVQQYVKLLQEDPVNVGKPFQELQTMAEEVVSDALGDGAPASAVPQVPTSPTPGGGETMQGPDGKQHPVIKTREDYEALPPGSTYYHGSKGQFMIKGGAGNDTLQDGPSEDYPGRQPKLDHLASRGRSARLKPVEQRTPEDWMDIRNFINSLGTPSPEWEREEQLLQQYGQ